MHILRQLPFHDATSDIEVAGEVVPVRPYQVVVWVSLSVRDVLDRDAPRFPAVLDTGHNHNFSIQERQLVAWAGLRPEALGRLGAVLVNRQEVPLVGGHLWVHRNRPGTADLLPRPYRMELPQGIALYPEGMPGAPRLPLLGLRGVVTNKLRLTIDGSKRSVSLRS